jgi:predicted dehydrogenase
VYFKSSGGHIKASGPSPYFEPGPSTVTTFHLSKLYLKTQKNVLKTTMAPIRVGIIGLSAKAATLGPGAWASIALLPTFQSNPAFEIVALCNSSIEAAKRSVEWHKLPASTKVYGDVELLAQDPDVDLVVVSVQVVQHLKLTLPALRNKKNLFVEWPLGASTEEAEQMTQLAEASNLKTIVGVQARGNPVISKAKEIIDSGEIGEITSTSAVALYPAFVSGFWFEGVEYYMDIKSGGNTFHITFAHCE